MYVLLVVAIFLLLSAGPSSAVENHELKSLLNWVPKSSEVLLINVASHYLGVDENECEADIWIFRSLPTSLIYQLDGGKIESRFRGKVVRHAVFATRNISHGALRGYLGGQVILFENNLSTEEISMIERCYFKHYKHEKYKVGIIKGNSTHLPQDHHLFISVPEPNLLVIGLDQLFVEELLTNIQSRSKSDSCWNTLSITPDNAFVAYREYKKSSTDLWSPFTADGAFQKEFADPKARSILMRFPGYSPKKVSLKYCGSPSGANAIATVLNHPFPIAKAIKKSDSYTDFEVCFSSKEESMIFALSVMGLFGHSMSGFDL
ncbi:MAG: hypothetical protein H6677_20495 [Candidatus Obscuribacterales bacterium]|nr:hypothetical protein [Candidatus Obscuribacterales bacterium]